jgi:hypothetical protein
MRGEGLIPGGGCHVRTPDSLRHLHISVIGRALVECDGNVSKAADKLGVPSADLRRMTRTRRELVELIDEIEECFLDRCEAKLHEALYSDDWRRADPMARFILSHHRLAFERGYCSPANVSVNVAANVAVAPTVYRWADGTIISERQSPPAAIPEARGDPPADETPPE